MGVKLKPCPFCGNAWVYASIGDYGSGYEDNGYRINCKCGYAWKTVKWHNTINEAIEVWNKEVE